MTATPADRFWEWIAANQRALRRSPASDAPILDELLERLHAYDPDVYFLIGGIPGGTTELIWPR